MSDITFAPMIAVLTASLLGSPHCAAMCGGFVTLAGRSTQPLRRVIGYHLGRLVSYLALGAGAGSVASWWPPFLLGGLLVVIGLATLVGQQLVPKAIHRALTRAYQRGVARFASRPALFPAVIGLLSALLPCGWLYIYAGVAAASPQPMITMAIFWVGTLPILTAWSVFSKTALESVGRYYQPLKGILLVAAGVFALIQHLPSPADTGASAPTCAHRHN